MLLQAKNNCPNFLFEKKTSLDFSKAERGRFEGATDRKTQLYFLESKRYKWRLLNDFQTLCKKLRIFPPLCSRFCQDEFFSEKQKSFFFVVAN